MAQGWALIAWDRENDPWLNIERVSRGYMAQDIDRKLKETTT